MSGCQTIIKGIVNDQMLFREKKQEVVESYSFPYPEKTWNIKESRNLYRDLIKNVNKNTSTNSGYSYVKILSSFF